MVGVCSGPLCPGIADCVPERDDTEGAADPATPARVLNRRP